jgi:signal transduction histidine kinase
MRTRGVWPDRRTLGKDAILWLALSFPVLVSLVASAAVWWRYPVELVAVVVLVAAGRVYPPAAFVVAVLASFLDPAFVFALPVASFRTGRLVPSLLPAAVILVGCGIAAPALGVGGPEWVDAMVVLVFCGVLPWLVGHSWRQYQVLVHTGWQRADQLEREQRMRAEQARLRERARIARDMHDSLGHELGLIALRAGALELDGDLDERHRAAVGELRVGIGDATERLRDVIGVLRDVDESASTVPGHAGPADLVERAAASGMDVTLHEDGAAEPPPLVERAVYRIVQESLTNAARHAPGAASTVRLAHAPDETTVTVVNERPARHPAGNAGGGHGLLGLRERVRLLGGEFTADTDADGGFRVTARLPHGAGMPVGALPEASGTTESLRQRAQAQRTFRRSVAVTFLVPGALAVLMVLVVAGQYVYSALTTTLDSAAFARMDVGQSRARIASLLPPRGIDASAAAMTPPAPPGTTCEFYRADMNPVNAPRLYRLCYAHDRLAAKDVVHPVRGNG